MTDDVEEGVEVDNFGYFAFLWELTNYERRLRVGMMDHTSWNTLLRFAKLSFRDFPDDEDINYVAT